MSVPEVQHQEPATAAANPFAIIQELIGGYAISRCLHLAAEIGVADALDAGPHSASDLAAAIGADADALDRVLRLLSAHGVFAVEGDGFTHTPASQLLRSAHPRSMRAFTRMFGLQIFWETFGALGHSIQTGQPASAVAFPEGFWAYLSAHPEEGQIFNAAMAGKAGAHVASIIHSYDFSHVRSVADIGGGSGHLLLAVLDAVPQASGVLFDLPHVTAEAAGIASERLTLQPGNFFKDDLPVCDTYLLMEIIHDWGDDESAQILQAVGRAAPPHARLLLIESIIPDTPGPDWAKVLDIVMLALLGGRQRNRQQYEALLQRAGFQLEQVIDTEAGISVLEASIV